MELINSIEIVFTDLDGTLLNSDSECSTENYKALTLLGEKSVTRVAATGRSLFSVHKVLSMDFPIDYLIFSSGAGIMDWQHKRILLSHSIEPGTVAMISEKLKSSNIDFMIHYPIPENHYFVYHSTGNVNPDFYRRIEIYKDFAEALNFSLETFGSACQILAVIPNDLDLFKKIKNMFADIKIIRATSPIDNHSIWVEIFPVAVSKALAAEWLCNYLGIKQKHSLSIGNDYNDIEMLEFTEHSYLVANSPEVLKKDFNVCLDNDSNAFAELMRKVNNQIKSKS